MRKHKASKERRPTRTVTKTIPRSAGLVAAKGKRAAKTAAVNPDAPIALRPIESDPAARLASAETVLLAAVDSVAAGSDREQHLGDLLVRYFSFGHGHDVARGFLEGFVAPVTRLLRHYDTTAGGDSDDIRDASWALESMTIVAMELDRRLASAQRATRKGAANA